MNKHDKALTLEFRKRLPVDVKDHVTAIMIFGSRARGDASPYSDLDMAVLVDRRTVEIERKLRDIAYQVMWDHDFKPVISLKVFSRKKFDKAVRKKFSFYRHVMSEGISL